VSAVLKELAVDPGVYEGLSMDEYLAMPAANASLMLTLLDRCPRAAWFDSWLNPRRPASASTPAQSVGTLAHALFLDGSRAKLRVIDPNDYPTKSSGNIPDGWTNKDIRAARDEALASGDIPVFPDVAADVEGMVAEARAYLETCRHAEPAVHALFQPGGGKSEVTIVWEEDGCLFRIRPDRLSADLCGDMKTTKTTAEPDKWGRTQLFGMGYYVAAAFYRRGILAATGNKVDSVYLAQEQDKPHLCSLIGLDPMACQLGERKAERAIMLWKRCMKTGEWPGYPARVAYPETPAWEAAREEVEEAAGIPYDIEKLWEKPK
jgi:hypothetical protein